jgi:putative N-acetyltransferase (TIGR04045 family)
MPHRIHVRIVANSEERSQAFAIRRRVFQDEQGVPAEEEFDTDDERATHVLAERASQPVGTGRIVFHAAYAKIGRMAVLKEHRRRGVGRALMDALVGVATEQGCRQLVLHAQVHAIPFYDALGFHIVGGEFEEAGIPHRRMQKVLQPKESS